MGTRGNSRKREAMRRRLEMLEGGDGCWLCLAPLHPELPAGHPLSTEIDEEIPVSLGGDPLDIENCHLVHRQCNLRKGNKVLKRGAFAALRLTFSKPKTSRRW